VVHIEKEVVGGATAKEREIGVNDEIVTVATENRMET